MLGQDRRLEEFRGVDLEKAVEREVAVEGPHAEEDARLRPRADVIFMERGGKLLEVFELHLQRRQPALVKKPHEVTKVVTVSLLGVDGVVAVQLQVAHETTHEVSLR